MKIMAHFCYVSYVIILVFLVNVIKKYFYKRNIQFKSKFFNTCYIERLNKINILFDKINFLTIFLVLRIFKNYSSLFPCVYHWKRVYFMIYILLVKSAKQWVFYTLLYERNLRVKEQQVPSSARSSNFLGSGSLWSMRLAPLYRTIIQ